MTNKQHEHLYTELGQPVMERKIQLTIVVSAMDPKLLMKMLQVTFTGGPAEGTEKGKERQSLRNDTNNIHTDQTDGEIVKMLIRADGEVELAINLQHYNQLQFKPFVNIRTLSSECVINFGCSPSKKTVKL